MTDRKVIGTIGLSAFSGYEVYAVNDEYITTGYCYEDNAPVVRTTKLYDGQLGTYFKRYGQKVYLHDIIRTGVC